MATTVVHIRKHKGEYVYIGRGSIFGNPYKITKDTPRADVIAAYAIYFEQRINRDPAFAKAVEGLKGKALG